MDVSEVDQNDEDSDSESQKIVKKRKRYENVMKLHKVSIIF